MKLTEHTHEHEQHRRAQVARGRHEPPPARAGDRPAPGAGA